MSCPVVVYVNSADEKGSLAGKLDVEELVVLDSRLYDP